jgi:WD repeat-containing protein 68
MRIDSPEVTILDIRMPCVPASVLTSHEAPCNGIAWAPHSPCHICTAADDHKALIWDIQYIPEVRDVLDGRKDTAGPTDGPDQ